MKDIEEFSLVRPAPWCLRLIFAAAGLFAIITPAWELRHAFFHPGWVTAPIGAMVLASWCVGWTFVAAAIFEEAQHWRVRDGEILIFRSNALRSWTTTVRARDISEISIREQCWDSGPNTFNVVLSLHSGETFGTQGFERRHNAERLEERLRGHLRLT